MSHPHYITSYKKVNIKKNQILASMVVLMLIVAGYLNYTYDPTKDPSEYHVNEELAKKWLDNGAKPTETVARIFKSCGITK